MRSFHATATLAVLFIVITAGLACGAEYAENFTLPDDKMEISDDTVLVGNANFAPSVQGNRLQLIENSNSNNSAFHIPALPDSSQGFVVSFDFEMNDPLGGNPPADGFSFSYGAIPFGTNSAQPEEGWPGVSDVLSFEVDAWRAGDTEVGPAIGLNRPASVAGLGNSLHESSLAHLNGDIFNDGETVTGTATISWDPAAGASFTTTGLITNANFVFVPTPGFAGDDLFTFAIAARTGGANLELLIDNISITTGPVDTDGDGLPDGFEVTNGLDPLDPTGNNGAAGDPDGDELTNAQEFALGTDPQNGDTDGDGLSDKVETNTGIFAGPSDTGSDPTNANTDGDGVDDGVEIIVGRNPNVADDPAPSHSYTQNFDALPAGFTALGDGSSLVSNGNFTPVVEAGMLRLTQNSNANNTAYHIPALLNSSEGFSASFDFQLFDPAGGNPPADGFSFSYGNIPFGTISAVAEEGWPGVSDVLSFEVDTWRVGDTEVGPAIGLNRPASVAGLGNSLHESSLAHLNGDIFRDGEFVSGTATISWDPAAGASFTTTGLITNANFVSVPTPGFTGDDSFTFAIAARTGGANESLLIDNLVITTPPSFELNLDIEADGNDLVFTWKSRAGRVYEILMNTRLSQQLKKWTVLSGDIAATPDTNTLTAPRPLDAEMFFIVVERRGP